MLPITKREYFAGIALQGLLSQHIRFTKKHVSERLSEFAMEPVFKPEYISGFDNEGMMHDSLCMEAINIADVLIEKLKLTEPKPEINNNSFI